MSTPDAMAQSFSLANMVPQDQTHNGGAWSQIEQDTRKYVMRASGDVYVFTGPVYADKPRTIGSGVAVPAYIYRSCTTPPPGARGCTGSQQRQHQGGPPISYEEFVKRTGLRLLPEAG